MAIESVLRVVAVVDGHYPIPGHFSDDAGGSDGSTSAVAFFNGFLRKRVGDLEVAVDQQVIGLGLKSPVVLATKALKVRLDRIVSGGVSTVELVVGSAPVSVLSP